MFMACQIILMMLGSNDVGGTQEATSRTREEISSKERWNVEALYVSLEDWKKEFEKMRGMREEPRWPDLKKFEGKLHESSHFLKKFLDSYFELDRTLSKLYTYAHLRFDEDVGSDLFKEQFGKITSLLHDFQLEYSWVEPELLSLKESLFKKLLQDKELSSYRFYLEKIERMRPHTLSSEEEAILALSGKSLETSYKAFGALNNADLKFLPAKTSQGKEKELTTGTYSLYMRDPDRSLRKSAFENLNKGYEDHLNTLCELLQGQIQGHLFAAKAKKFKDCREFALFSRRIDASVYDNLITTIHQNLGTLHEYLVLRKEMLEVKELHPYDLYVPLVKEFSSHREYVEACKLVVDSVLPLGKNYTATLEAGLLREGWVDPFENQRKRSGAYSSGCYDSMPYILMNYHGTLNDVLTLAHEAGHSMHSYLSRKNQPYVYADYPIFVAEVASTFNEQLLLKTLKDRASSKEELAYLINYEIEQIRTTIIRQTMFAEFELKLHRFAETGVPFTPSLLKKEYLELNRKYYGSELVLDGGLEVEWARIPHFYYNFYVYQYATGLSASMALFEQAMQSEKAKEHYLRFLSSGGSKYPLDLLKEAGVDLTTKEPVEAAMKKFSSLVKELRELVKK